MLNSTFGKRAGDELLRQLGARLSSELGDSSVALAIPALSTTREPSRYFATSTTTAVPYARTSATP